MQPWKSENEAGRDRRFYACHVDCRTESTQAPARPFALAFADFASPVAAERIGVCSVDINIKNIKVTPAKANVQKILKSNMLLNWIN